ncbi:MAG: YezD family protein [Nitrospiraceae bacterium]
MKPIGRIFNEAEPRQVDIQDKTDPQGDQDIERKILLALKGIRYGSVEIVIHDSRLVQIERKEKIRFDTDGGGKG